MQYINLPQYVKNIKQGHGKRIVKIGELFDTSIPNNFSIYTWQEILLITGVDNWSVHFEEITEEEYTGILKNYEIY